MLGRVALPAALCLLVVAIGLALPLAARAAATGDPAKVKALVVGVAEYRDKRIGALPRSASDAAEVKRALVEMLKVPEGNVRLLDNNPTREQIRAAWEEHVGKLKPNEVSIFFFSGHGAQHNRQQYLLASDFDARRDPDYTGLALVDLLRKLRADERANLGIFFVDACRTVRGRTARTEVARESPEQTDLEMSGRNESMAPVRAPEGTFIFYAASANQVALHDLGKGDDSAISVYTRMLLPLIEDPHRGLHEVAKDVRWQTYELALTHRSPTGEAMPNVQIPAYYDDALRRQNILGKPLPVTPVKPEKGKLPGHIAGLKSIWACASCPEMVPIPAASEPWKVRAGAAQGAGVLLGPYEIGKYEVTRDEWRACQAAAVCRVVDDAIIEGDRHPMTGVTYEDALKFVEWLNSEGMPGSLPGAGKFRLPTEAEWEHAAAGGSSSEYGPASDVRDLCDFSNGADASLKSLLWANPWCNDGKARGTTTAGSYRPNGYGVHDMQGNVWEWVDECYDRPACTLRIAKGGSWRSGPEALKIGVVQAFAADSARQTVGFRVMREAR